MRIAFVLLCALPAAAAFSVQDLFGKPRTRARAKGYAVDAIRQKYTPPPTKGDQTPKKNPSPSRTSSPKMLVPPPMEAIDATSQLLCEVLDASGGRVAGEPPPNLSSSSVVIVIIPCQYAESPRRDASVESAAACPHQLIGKTEHDAPLSMMMGSGIDSQPQPFMLHTNSLPG